MTSRFLGSYSRMNKGEHRLQSSKASLFKASADRRGKATVSRQRACSQGPDCCVDFPFMGFKRKRRLALGAQFGGDSLFLTDSLIFITISVLCCAPFSQCI